MLELNDNIVDSISFTGLEDYNMFTQSTNILGGENIFKFTKAVSHKEKLPTKLRMGTSFSIVDHVEVGFDIIIPLNKSVGSFAAPILAIGGDIEPGDIFRISTGFTIGGNYGFNLPFGFGLTLGEKKNYELGVATHDIITFFGQNKPTLSASIGFIRFRF